MVWNHDIFKVVLSDVDFEMDNPLIDEQRFVAKRVPPRLPLKFWELMSNFIPLLIIDIIT